MAVGIPSPRVQFFPAARGRAVYVLPISQGVCRLPTDPLFYAALTLENIVVGSRYRVTRRSTGDELATGVAASTDELISSIPCYANPMQVDITVRNASGSPVYKVFDTGASIPKTGATAYILQTED